MVKLWIQTRRTFIFLTCFLLVSCQIVNDGSQSPTEQSVSVFEPPTIVTETARPAPSLMASIVPTSHVPTNSPTITPQMTAAPIPSAILDKGALFFAGIGQYGWFELKAQETLQELVFDDSNSYHEHSTQELIAGPGQSAHIQFSHYSDQVAFAKLTSPGEFWLSDVTYRQSENIFVDTEQKFSDPVSTWGSLRIAWAPDDLHVFLYHLTKPELSLVYDLKTSQLDNWYWSCNSVVLSPQSGRLATLCPKMFGITEAQTQKAYAILEWGGAIWFTDELIREPFLQPTSDGTFLWQWSSDGQSLAYFDPEDIYGHLLISDSQGNTTQLLPGISVFKEPEQQEIRYLPPIGETFIWARNAPILLVRGYSPDGELCPPFVTPYDPGLFILSWPCWQMVDIDSGKVVWSEKNIIESLFALEGGEPLIRVSMGDIAISPDGRLVAFRIFDPHRLILADSITAQLVIIAYNAIDRLYWTSTPTD